MAASATFALKAGLWVRRARLAIVAPDPRHSRRSQADFPLIGLSEFAQPPGAVCHKPFVKQSELAASLLRTKAAAAQIVDQDDYVALLKQLAEEKANREALQRSVWFHRRFSAFAEESLPPDIYQSLAAKANDATVQLPPKSDKTEKAERPPQEVRKRLVRVRRVE